MLSPAWRTWRTDLARASCSASLWMMVASELRANMVLATACAPRLSGSCAACHVTSCEALGAPLAFPVARTKGRCLPRWPGIYDCASLVPSTIWRLEAQGVGYFSSMIMTYPSPTPQSSICACALLRLVATWHVSRDCPCLSLLLLLLWPAAEGLAMHKLQV